MSILETLAEKRMKHKYGIEHVYIFIFTQIWHYKSDELFTNMNKNDPKNQDLSSVFVALFIQFFMLTCYITAHSPAAAPVFNNHLSFKITGLMSLK